MDVRELYRARREGRFTLRHWLWAWLISLRAFAWPWVFLYTAFGALLAGCRDASAIALTALVPVLTLAASHFRNNYRDVELGIDRYVESPEEAERVISTLKPYTAAAWLVPLRITPIWFQKLNEYLFLALSAAVYSSVFTPHNLPLYVLGALLAETYTDWWKRWRLGEVAAFLGHGFATVAFGYLTFSDNVVYAVLAGIPTGLISALAYSVDQFVDVKTDFVARVRALYESWFNSRMPLSLYVIVAVMTYSNVLVAWVAAGIYPRGTLLAMLVIPLTLFRAPALEWDRERALRDLALTTTWLLPLLMCLGALL